MIQTIDFYEEDDDDDDDADDASFACQALCPPSTYGDDTTDDVTDLKLTSNFKHSSLGQTPKQLIPCSYANCDNSNPSSNGMSRTYSSEPATYGTVIFGFSNVSLNNKIWNGSSISRTASISSINHSNGPCFRNSSWKFSDLSPKKSSSVPLPPPPPPVLRRVFSSISSLAGASMTVPPPNVGSNEYGLDESAVVPVLEDDDLALAAVVVVVVVAGWNASVVVIIPDDSSNASNSIARHDHVEDVLAEDPNFLDKLIILL
eukprot:CAMPEP_0113454786 /NCGR_PEP_ID=MMETSP0014_2-20120614/8043_1 /TAXON_ID=2857 /ORGANISM="Nitzschia sp." /LENGTH=259 /DNA_ID=CAMNT_0000346203 /DNA_START=615 /DNA_END=1394 /DNA_ORIENTATION=- /assembly_acc=CAM_ASM_000159